MERSSRNGPALVTGGALLVAGVLAAGCLFGSRTQAVYSWGLDAVARTADVPHALTIDDLEARDDRVRHELEVTAGQVRCECTNASSQPLELLLESAMHRDEDGEERPLLVATSPWSGSPPRTVEPGASVVLFLWPHAWMRADHEGSASTYRALSPLDGHFLPSGRTREAAIEAGRADVGRSFTLVIPVRVGEEEIVYELTFTVEGVAAESISWA